MSRVTDLSVRDFKAVEEASVEPGGVNLLVGRNNVGKTSLLEALHLALDPSSISRFDGNLDKVVQEGAEVAELAATVSGDGATENLHVNVERPSEKDVVRQLEQTISKCIISIIDTEENSKENGRNLEVRDAVTDAISDLNSDALSEDLIKHSAVLKPETSQYVYFRVPERHWSLLEFFISDAMSSLSSDNRVEHRVLSHIKKGIKFERDDTDRDYAVRFVTDPAITDDTPDPNADGTAIRRSRIEDFLTEEEIVDGLVDFSFDRLVFEDGDEREEVPYDFMGSGFKTLVGILWELYDPEADNEILLIEEPAVHMHPGYVNEFTQQLLRVAREEEVQLFVTTHREDLIESFFAPPTRRSHGEYLREEFQVIQMTELLTKQLDYEQAETELDELNTDLRGI